MINENREDILVLVDQNDIEIGSMPKLAVHQYGLLHRAFSVFVFNTRGELLLQRRAEGKYHSPGLWTNTCCSHPRVGELVETAAERRLLEEMGMVCELEKKFDFVYRAEFDNGLTEYEFDHVYIGITDVQPDPNPDEVGEWKYVYPEEMEKDIALHPEHYTEWHKIAWPKLRENLHKH